MESESNLYYHLNLFLLTFNSASAQYLRQSILLSAYETPETRALFNRSLKNVAGKVRTERTWGPVQVPEGIQQVGGSFVYGKLSNTIPL